jgi:hypothetical protein
MSKTRALLAVTAALFALAFAGKAAAAPAVPYGGGTVGTAQGALPILPTGLFDLGVDLSSFGVDPSELSTVGPVPSTSSPTGSMLIVDDDGLDCPNWQFHTIQAAVNMALPGVMIKVCRGTYKEQVLIGPGKDGLTLVSVGDLQAVIKPPTTPIMFPRAIVEVRGAQNVTIRHFTVSGPGDGPCDSLEYGVLVDGGGSATISDNHITHIHDTPFSNCDNGVGVLVGRNADGTVGTGTIVHNLIDDYQKGGIVVDGVLPDGGGPLGPISAGSDLLSPFAEVAYNEVDGIGPTAVIPQNGIQVSRGANANVHHNVVQNNVFSTPPVAAVGIMLLEVMSSQTTVHHNDVHNNGEGIGLYTTSNIEVGWNRSHDNAPYDGVFAEVDTSMNTIEHNLLKNNTLFDCDDSSVGTQPGLVANTWIQDLGYTENKPGLCKHATTP